MDKYSDFIAKKQITDIESGFEWNDIHPMLFDFQRDIVKWAIKRGRAAIFADCGLGKTFMQLEWARAVSTYGDILILAPLAVATQTAKEALKLQLNVNICRDQEDILPGINITNYEMIHKFDLDHFAGIVLDESSILKSYTGKIRNQIIETTQQVKYKLACTATPAPNDHMELGNHAEFLGTMSRVEMLSMFFVHDGGDTSKWRLKGHAEDSFWKWICSWAVNMRKPSDLGYDDNDFNLPELIFHHHVVKKETASSGFLFPVEALTLQERQQERKATIVDRVNMAAAIINSTDDHCLVWCNLNKESELLAKAIDGCVEVSGSDKIEKKEIAVRWFLCDNSLELIGNKIVEVTPCQAIPISKNTTPKTEKKGLTTQENGNKQTEKKEKSTWKNTEKTIQTSGKEPEKNKKKSMLREEKNMQKTENIGTSKNCKSKNSTKQIQKYDLTKDLKNMESTPMTIDQSLNLNQEDVLSADQKILDVQKRSDCMLITATQPEKSGGCCASTATKELESSKTIQNYSERQQNTSKRVMVSKPRIFGYGLNLQHCSNVFFVGLSDSYEQFYQAVRRCWRFGQKNNVNVHIITAETEGAVVKNIQRKEADAEKMADSMVFHMAGINAENVKGITRDKTEYKPNVDMDIPSFLKY